MVIVGYDPGSISCGVGIVRKKGRKIEYVYSEEIKLKKGTLVLRMKQLWDKLLEINRQYQIDEAAVEESFLGKNVKTMAVLSMIRGMIIGLCHQQNMNIGLYSPREVKQFVTGSGNAQKIQVQKMMTILLNINKKKIGLDESDALATAYCHAMKQK